MKTPSQGGSYIRQKDGSLKRVEFAKPVPDKKPGTQGDTPTEPVGEARQRASQARAKRETAVRENKGKDNA